MDIGIATVAAVGLGAIAWVLVVALFLLKRRGAVRRVDDYSISLEDREGFKVVRLKLKEESGKVATYDFDPPYSHVLSDQLCTASARAMVGAHGAR